MAWMIDTKSKRRLATVAVLSAMFGFVSVAGPAHAEDRHGDRHDRHDWHGGGYRGAPPVVYGSPYYAAPPVVYGSPGFGINLNIR